MYGEDIGSLVIYTSTKSNPMTEVNRITGEQGNQWIKLNTDIGITYKIKNGYELLLKVLEFSR